MHMANIDMTHQHTTQAPYLNVRPEYSVFCRAFELNFFSSLTVADALCTVGFLCLYHDSLKPPKLKHTQAQTKSACTRSLMFLLGSAQETWPQTLILMSNFALNVPLSLTVMIPVTKK